MAITAEEVIVKLRAEMADYDRKISNSTRITEQAFKSIGDRTAATEAILRKNSAAMVNSVKGLGASFATYLSGRELASLSDAFTRLQNNLRVAGLEGAELKQVQDRLFSVAQKYGVEIEGLSNLFGQLTQASKELGATQNQVFGITEAVSASLKITGLSSQEASGALLQLTQALRGGKLQAEEYGSLLDGLYPLLEAAANGSSRFGGSVAKLTAQVKDGKVSSKEFFDAILAGSAVLDGKAAKASLTLSSGFTTLTNALTVYVGEADKANGVSATLGTVMQKIADNLDTLIPAIAVVTAALGVNYVIGAVNAANATAALSGGLSILQRLPVVAVITAIGAAFAYVATESARASARIADLDANIDSLQRKIDAAGARAVAAGQSIVTVGNASTIAAGKVDKLGQAFQSAAGQAATLAAQAKIATLAMIGSERSKVQGELATIQSQRQTAKVAGGIFGTALPILDYATGERSRRAQREARRTEQEASLRARLKQLDALEGSAASIDPDYFVDPKAPSVPPPAAGGKKTKGPKGPAGPTADEVTAQYTQQLRQIVGRDLQARLAMATNGEDRAEIEQRLLNDDIRSAEEEIKGNKQFSAARKAKLLSELKSYEGVERARIDQERAERAARVEVNDLADKRQTLEVQTGLMRSRSDRLAAENRILDFVEEQERKELEIAISAGEVADAEAARARLSTRQAARRTDTNRKGASPMERYLEGAQDDLSNMGDRIEQIQVSALDRLTDGIAEAGAEYLKLGGLAGSVINGIISDLIRLAARQAIVAAFGGGSAGAGGGGSGFFGTVLGSIGSSIGSPMGANRNRGFATIAGNFKSWRASK